MSNCVPRKRAQLKGIGRHYGLGEIWLREDGRIGSWCAGLLGLCVSLYVCVFYHPHLSSTSPPLMHQPCKNQCRAQLAHHHIPILTPSDIYTLKLHDTAAGVWGLQIKNLVVMYLSVIASNPRQNFKKRIKHALDSSILFFMSITFIVFCKWNKTT